MKIAILADVHANLSALQAVLESINAKQIDHYVLLGDIIDYGMRPNETIHVLEALAGKVICNIWGNHEKAVIEKALEKFSSQRGRDCSDYTSQVLNPSSVHYIKNKMETSGSKELNIDGKKLFFIHGSLEDPFWKSITVKSLPGGYQKYDYVFSAHSHRPHIFEHYYDIQDQKMRGEKKTVFINVGSVGQPRNHNSRAQYGIFDTETGSLQLEYIEYDVTKEQELYHNEVDAFYKERLALGI